jgi:phage terminase large subunit
MTATLAAKRNPFQKRTEILAAYQPLRWQVPMWRDKNLVVLATGSAGGGKSRAAAEKVHAYLLKYAGATGLMLRKAREYCKASIVPFMAQSVIGDDPRVTMIKSENRFVYENGSVLWWGGMKDDDQREALRSIGQEGGLDIVWMEEANAFSELDFEELLARMRGRAAWPQVIMTTNPGAPSHWIYKRIIQGGEGSVYYSGAADNPHNPAGYIDTLNRLTGVLRSRLVEGRWVQAEGAVYDEWDDAVHLIDPFPIPSDWRRFRSIDFGFTNPFVCQWWALDPDDRMYLYREIYMSGRLVEDHARQIVALEQGEAIDWSVSDHDAEDRATLERHGVYTNPARKEVSPGINAVKQRLRVQEDGKPRLYLMRGALVEEDTRLREAKKPVSTLEEMTGYVWQKSADGRPVKEQPVKLDDHGMDALRYAVMGQESDPWVLFEL